MKQRVGNFKTVFWTGLISVFLLAACSQEAASTEISYKSVTPEEASRSQISGDQSPQSTPTSKPTDIPSPTAPPPLEAEVHFTTEIKPPWCVEDGREEPAPFTDLLGAFLPAVYEMDSFRYRAQYSYETEDGFSDDELALQVIGTHRGLISETAEVEAEQDFSYKLVSQIYEDSQVQITDLKASESEEYHIIPDGVWYRPQGEAGWVTFAPGDSTALINIAEAFSPHLLPYMASGIHSETPLMVKTETIDGKETVHRCWQTPDGVLIHAESLYTFLEDVEVHLWTADDDTQLVRLALKGKSPSWTYFQEELIEHDPPHDLFIWLELTDVNQPIEIQLPVAEQSEELPIPQSAEVSTSISAPRNKLPVPEDAKPADVERSIFQLGTVPIEFSRREYWTSNYAILSGLLDLHLNKSWYKTPADQLGRYETSLSPFETLQFYLETMPAQGWALEHQILQAGETRYYLVFSKDGISVPVVIRPYSQDSTIIEALLPPDEDMLVSLLTGWQAYTHENSDLQSSSISTIAFDSNGQVWVGSEETRSITFVGSDGTTRDTPHLEGGLSIFDGEDWVPFDVVVFDIPTNNIRALALSENDELWLSTRDDIFHIVNDTVETFSTDEFGLDYIFGMQVNGPTVWAVSPDGISSYNGRAWNPAQLLYTITAFDVDPFGVPWVGTNGGGLYSLENGEWVEHLASNADEAGHYNDSDIDALQFDSQGRVWIMSASEGVRVFDGEAWEYFRPDGSEVRPGHLAKHMTIDPADRVWVIDFSGRVYMLDATGQWVDYTPLSDGIPTYSPDLMIADTQGRIWIGTDAGVAVFTAPAN